MGLQYKNEHGDCPITLTVPGSGVRGYLVTKCVVENDGSGPQEVIVAHDTVTLDDFWLAHNTGGADITTSPFTSGAIGGASFTGDSAEHWPTGVDRFVVIPRAKDVRKAAGVWIGPGESFTVTGTDCRASVTYLEEI